MLAAGHGVEDAGRRAGYRGIGYWKRTFKESMGVPPGRYFAALVEPVKIGHRDSHPARPSPPAVEIHPDSGALSPGIVGNLEGRALGLHTPMHQHDDGELQWPEGVMTIGTERGTWVGHDGLAVWLPVGALHDSQAWLTMRRRFRIRPDLAARLPSDPCAIRLDPLTRQALLDLIPSKRPHSRETRGGVVLQARHARRHPALTHPLDAPHAHPTHARRLAPRSLRRSDARGLGPIFGHESQHALECMS